ncbi:Der f 30 allergen-like protein [Dinothrombium tinctorium]|uniref:Der f 30 allergen-like protein n=1 Tax=Dinothrombium tinctorium TaxID=1965070 RepID=A0A3S3RZS8_9ACAR|nr:Der f 30 allergen-like protein [Dinothrombium tinctorium]
MADLKPAEVEKAKLHFDIYDLDGIGKVDASLLGDLLRSLDLRPTNNAVEKAGGTKKKGKNLYLKIYSHRLFINPACIFLGEKLLTLEEFLPIYSQVKKDKDVGAFEDLMEGLKVYDKNENGTMLQAELAHVLLSLGEKLTDAEVEEIMKACAGQEDDEGYIKYETFVKNVFAGPFPEEAAAQ